MTRSARVYQKKEQYLLQVLPYLLCCGRKVKSGQQGRYDSAEINLFSTFALASFWWGARLAVLSASLVALVGYQPLDPLQSLLLIIQNPIHTLQLLSSKSSCHAPNLRYTKSIYFKILLLKRASTTGESVYLLYKQHSDYDEQLFAT